MNDTDKCKELKGVFLMKFDSEEIVLRLEELANLAFVMMILHENYSKQGNDVVRISDSNYIKLFSLIHRLIDNECQHIESNQLEATSNIC